MSHATTLNARAEPRSIGRTRWRVFGGLIATLLGAGAGLSLATGYLGGAVWRDHPVPQTRATPPPGAAVFLSGDMGPNFSLARYAIDRLARGGVPVVSVNSLAFFRHERTPAEVRALIARSIRRAIALSGADRVVLIGQSFGADSIPIGLADLPSALRRRLGGVILIVPATSYEMRASPSEIFSWTEPEHPAAEQLDNLGDLPVVCLRGAEETDSLCPELAARGATVITMAGGHRLAFDGDGLARWVGAETHRLLASR